MNIDFVHMDNIIQREVIAIEEHTPKAQQGEEFQALLDFLTDQVRRVTISKLKAAERL